MLFFSCIAIAQNVGIGTTSPAAKLHIRGSADTTQLFIEAASIQSNIHPLVKLRNSSGADLLWINADNAANSFIGYNTGRFNNAGGGATGNSFLEV